MEMASATVRGPNASAMVSATMDDSTVVMMTDEAESQRRSWRASEKNLSWRASEKNIMIALVFFLAPATAMSKPPLVPRRLYKDWVALNSRSTARHLMKPLTNAGREECLTLKLQIREEVSRGVFVSEAFSAAAKLYSIDTTSSAQGGLLGERIRQGVCQEPELDRACFCSPLGRVTGPIQSKLGWHLVLVEERIGLEMHDSGMTRVVPKPREAGDGVDSVLAAPDPDEQSEMLDAGAIANLAGFVLLTSVGSQVLSNWAASIDLEEIAARVS